MLKKIDRLARLIIRENLFHNSQGLTMEETNNQIKSHEIGDYGLNSAHINDSQQFIKKDGLFKIIDLIGGYQAIS